MTRQPYTLLDRRSDGLHWPHCDGLKWPHPPAAEHIEIWHNEGKRSERLSVDPEKIRRVTTA